MTAFAQQLGVRQSAISQYESGDVKPKATVLFRLHQLATKTEQKMRIRELLGDAGKQLLAEDSEHERRASELMLRFEGENALGAAQERFENLCVEILRSGDVPLWMIMQMELWLEVKEDLDARRRFEEMFSSIARSLATLKEARDLLKHGR